MGYDPFVGMGVPGVLGSPQDLFDKVMVIYNACVDFVRHRFPALWHDGLTLNTAGSPSYGMHEQERLSGEFQWARRFSNPPITIYHPWSNMCRPPLSRHRF
ncbi:hypothetical protein cym2001_41790 [Pseudomonas sp. CYM-20-01]|nr:hypothetical protein cym2001_41790 [Pseudomonas sp. CYM-20-01]